MLQHDTHKTVLTFTVTFFFFPSICFSFSHSMQYNIPIILTYNELFILSFRVRLASGIASTLRLLSAQVWGEACIVENNFENWTGTCERHNDKINGNFRWMHFLFFNVEPSNIYVIWIVVFFLFFCLFLQTLSVYIFMSIFILW